MRTVALARYVFICLMFMTFSVSANVKIERLDIQQPRSFGYQIGDKFETVVNLSLRHPYVLDQKSLPREDRISEWLKLESPDIKLQKIDDVLQYTIKLTYQIVNIKSRYKEITVPSLMLIYKDSSNESAERFNALVPSFDVSLSMVTTDSKNNLQPDREPSLLANSLFNTGVFSALLVFSLAVLAYLQWGIPVRTKDHPFANSYLLLHKRRHHEWNDDSQREVLKEIHQAFNKTAQKTVFVEQLDDFFNQHVKFIPLRSEIEDYFTYTRRYFFDGAQVNDDIAYSLSDLSKFVKRCRDIERGIT